MIKLQNLLLPKAGICFEKDMYFRPVMAQEHLPAAILDEQRQCCRFFFHDALHFDTYFNSFSIGKWKKYTRVGKILLRLELEGAFEIELSHMKIINGAVVRKILCTQQAHAAQREKFFLEFPDCDSCGALYFSLTALEDGSTFYGGSYETQLPQESAREVKIAVNICNYKREEYVYRTFDIIRRFILQNPGSGLHGNLKLYITDNSCTIDRDRVADPDVHVFQQGDFGGSGGFARGLLEISGDKERQRLTHAIMMDDDVLLEPEALERTFFFLRLMKEEYRSAFVGGALLRMDRKNIQSIGGGEWDTLAGYVPHKEGLDCNCCEHILLNEIEDGARLNGWWYNCIPIAELESMNLPYPFFFHIDDVEYDLRNCKRVIHLNGICVWHEPYEHKPGSQRRYFDMRNIIVTQMLYFPSWGKAQMKKYIRAYFLPLILTYRYREALLALRGARDALRGTQWLVSQDAEKLLCDVLEQGYEKLPIEALPMRLNYQQYLRDSFAPPESKARRLLRRITFNGYLLPAKGDRILPMYAPSARAAYRAKRILNYDPFSEKGYMTQKSYKGLLTAVGQYIQVQRLVDKSFEAAREDYRINFPKVTNEKFWRKYLLAEES